MRNLRSAFRSLARRRRHTAINVLGLGVGLAACLLIGLWVHDEVAFDRFHEHAERIYRLNKLVTPEGAAAVARQPAGPRLVGA